MYFFSIQGGVNFTVIFFQFSLRGVGGVLYIYTVLYINGIGGYQVYILLDTHAFIFNILLDNIHACITTELLF